ncbi:MAG TPA: hypothetical protein VLF19_13020, partial [Methylomirabilota bacterium]|nr:hypothetical protein [Methylomirabilota bacterium]
AAGDPRARAAGAAAGALVLGALAAAAGGLEAAAWPAPALSAWPALAAAPLAWGVTRVLAR